MMKYPFGEGDGYIYKKISQGGAMPFFRLPFVLDQNPGSLA